MPTLLRELRYAARVLARKPLFTLLVVATLALGIGLNTATFSAIDALVLRPLPGTRDPGELVSLYRSGPEMPFGSNSIPHYRDVRDRSSAVFSDAALWQFAMVNLSVDGKPERAMGFVTSANYFSVLGVDAMLGRGFAPDEEVGRGAHPVLVLSHHGWQKLGGDPAIVGRAVIVNGQQYTVVGVTAPEFKGSMPIIAPTFYVPLMQLDQIEPGASYDRLESRGNNSSNITARLLPGVTIEQARQRMDALSAELRSEYPDHYEDRGITVVPQAEVGIHPMFRSATVGLTSIVMAVVAMLLLVACLNVANLLLARATDRAREIAIRLSLGARRLVIIRQLLVESLLLAAISGAAGLLLAEWVIGMANRVSLPLDLDMSPDLSLSPKVLIFTGLVSLLTGVVFGLVPALQATRPAVLPALKGETPAGQSKAKAMRGLVVAQMALSIVLLVSAGLFLRNLQAASNIDKGFNPDNLLVAQLDPSLQGYDRARTEDFYRRLTERVQALPGVTAVGYADYPQLGVQNSDWSVEIPGYTPAENEGMSISVNRVTPGFFDAMQMRFLAGRGFTERDDTSAARVIVVNQRFVDRFWPGQDPLGRTVRAGGREYSVIGVVPTGKYRSIGEDPTAYMWLSATQSFSAGSYIHIRTQGDPIGLIPSLRAEVAALDPTLPLADVRTMKNLLGTVLLPARLAGTALGAFGAIGLLLAAIGIYGVMASAVAQRRREIGIRVAIGAAGANVVRLLLGEGLTLVGIGAAIGMLGALVAAKLIGGFLVGRSGLDPVTFFAVPLILGSVALLATWVPARRAARVDPIEALRAE
ncbi:MAG: ABC transporter permease [Gemmatimonadales bacterium]